MKRLLLTFIPFLASAQTINWSRVHYTDDKSTVSSRWHNLDVAYHYAWQDLHVIRQLRKDVKPTSILDVGPGAGHWCRLWHGLYPSAAITAIDLSQPVAETLLESGLVDSMIIGDVAKTDFTDCYDIISAIGVLHHIINDSLRIAAVQELCTSLTSSGVLFIGTQLPDSVVDSGYRKYMPIQWWLDALPNGFVAHVDIATPPTGFKHHLDLITIRRAGQ